MDVGDTERFSATASDVDDNLTGVEWTLDGRRQDDDDFSPTGRHESNHSVTFDRSGSHTVEVTFTDAKGERASHSWNVTVLSSSAPEIGSYSPREGSLTVEAGEHGEIQRHRF